jgi:hypothetical protein
VLGYHSHSIALQNSRIPSADFGRCMDRRFFAKLIGTAASSWAALTQREVRAVQEQHVRAPRDPAQSSSPNQEPEKCCWTDDLIPNPVRTTMLPGGSRAPSALQFSVGLLPQSRQEEFARLQREVFRGWRSDGNVFKVEVQVESRLGTPEIDDIPEPQAQEAYELQIQTFATLRAKNGSVANNPARR